MIVNVYFYGLQNSHHPLLEVYAHDFRNNKSQKKTPAAFDRCSTINYLFFIKTNTEFLNSNSPNWELFISFFSVLGLAIHHTLHETSLSKIPYYQPHLPTTSLLLPHRVIHTELSAYN